MKKNNGPPTVTHSRRMPYYTRYSGPTEAAARELTRFIDPNVYEQAMPNNYEFGVLCAGIHASANGIKFTKRAYAEFLVENSFAPPSHQTVQTTFKTMEEMGLIEKSSEKLELPEGRHRDIFIVTAKGLDVALRCGEVVRLVLEKAA